MSVKDRSCVEIASARAGFSCATGHRIAGSSWVAALDRPRRSRRRPDPLAEMFEEELVPLLVSYPELRAVDLFHKLQADHPDLDAGVRRTLERRVRAWKLSHGPDQEIFFQQEKIAGRQGISDFTVASSLGVTIAGEPLDHLLYHFRMPWSGFAYVVSAEKPPFWSLSRLLPSSLTPT